MQYPHHIYLDLDVINNNHTPGVSPPYLRCEEVRNTPFLDGDNSEYFCSIVGFTSQQLAIPCRCAYLSLLCRTIRRYPPFVLTLRSINWRRT